MIHRLAYMFLISENFFGVHIPKKKNFSNDIDF